MNDIVDDLASRHLERPPKNFILKIFPEAPPGYRVRLRYHKSAITSKQYKTLGNIHHDDQLQYILLKSQWSATVFNKVNWKAHQQAISRMTKFQQIALAKLVHNLANTNRQNFLLYKSTPLCPLCNDYEETFQHVLQCREASASTHRAAQLHTLEIHLINIQTPREIVRAILHGFREWQYSRQRSRALTFGSVYGPDVLLTSAYHEQFHDIGWLNFSLGRISQIWEKAAGAYWSQESKLVDLPYWSSQLIAALWHCTKALWGFRNQSVHGFTSEEEAQIILSKLQEQVRQHNISFSDNSAYILPRHHHLFTSRSLQERLQYSYDHLVCWLQSIDEARNILV
jgi:hypothetical protein